MKKYLMTVMAAVALGGMFTGCSKDADLSGGQNSAEFNIVQNYENAFVTRFGQPHANQTWGFGESVANARTRGVFSNGNEWAANDRDDCRYKVPPALTQPQIDAVVEYFQTVQKPQYQDPHWTEYFIQQVYKGGSSPRQGYSPEVYTAANGTTTVTGSSKMNYLAAYQNGVMDHNENFNGGDCGEKDNVLNYKGTLTTVEETYSVNDQTHRHKDKINLMTESTTQEFGYYVSNGSVIRKEYTGLVNFEKIIEVLGEEKAGCLRDGWNRSFMGFDYEMMTKEEAYQKNDDGTIKYLTYGDLPDAQYIWDGTSTYGSSRPAGTEFVLDAKGNKIPMLNSKTDGYCGVNGDIEQNSLIASHACEHKDRNPNQSDYYQSENCLNISVITGKVRDGFLPVYTGGAAGTKWVKFTGAADGYYSDWIVTLTEAQKYDKPNPPVDPTIVCRIIVEDLTVGESSDFDFNDVVFDVCKDGTLIIRAIGGELPIYIGAEGANEVHAVCSVTLGDTNKGANSHTMMRNTGWSSSGSKTNVGIDYDAVLGKISLGRTFSSKEEAKEIEIWVHKNGTNIRLQAPVGKVASMICVGQDYKWCAERQDIDDKYHKDGVKLFHQYVIGDPNYGDDWEHKNAWYQKLNQ